MSAEKTVSAKFVRSLDRNISWCGARPTIARSKARPEKKKKAKKSKSSQNPYIGKQAEKKIGWSPLLD